MAERVLRLEKDQADLRLDWTAYILMDQHLLKRQRVFEEHLREMESEVAYFLLLRKC